MFFQRLFGGHSEKNKQQKNNSPRFRKLRVESLESREMLSINPVPQGVWDEVTAKYSDLDWAQIGDYNYIETTAAQLSSDSALRSAISTAASTPENDLIVVRTTTAQNTITLGGTELAIDVSQYGSVTIVSLGDKELKIDANKKSRVLNIAEGTTVALAGLTITGGYTEDYGGGGILNRGVLSVINSAISNNTANYGGGGIYSAGELTVVNSTISGNKAFEGSGGGISGPCVQ